MSLARTGTQAGPIEMELAVGRWVRSRMIPGDLYGPLPHSAFVEVTLTPLRLWEGNFAAWGRERPSWPSVLVEGVKVHKSQVEWACSVFADSPPPLSATWLLYSHPCLLFVRFLPACCSFRNPVGAHGGERKTACEGAFIFISLTVGSVSWWYVEVVPVS